MERCINSTALRSVYPWLRAVIRPQARPALVTCAVGSRAFTNTCRMAKKSGNWLEPNIPRQQRMFKGRPRVPTGGSHKGTTVVYGNWGLRMTDHDRRISATQFKTAVGAIEKRLRGQKYRIYSRMTCNVGVFTKGNDLRMGKGKGSFDHWATRVAINMVVLELRGQIHEIEARAALCLAGQKLPGTYKFVRKGDPPYVGLTPLHNVTLEDLRKPWKMLPEPAKNPVVTAALSEAAATDVLTVAYCAAAATGPSPAAM